MDSCSVFIKFYFCIIDISLFFFLFFFSKKIFIINYVICLPISVRIEVRVLIYLIKKKNYFEIPYIDTAVLATECVLKETKGKLFNWLDN